MLLIGITEKRSRSLDKCKRSADHRESSRMEGGEGGKRVGFSCLLARGRAPEGVGV
jgi:hypothetical protein